MFKIFRCFSSGINITQVKFDRNFYLADEEVRVRYRMDNSRCSARSSHLVIKLIRTIKATGYTWTQAGVLLRGIQYPFEENIIIAQRHFPGVSAYEKQEDFSAEISVFLDSIDHDFTYLRKTKNKLWEPEDLAFATASLQPSTVGPIFSCLYTIVVNRTFPGIQNYPTGVSVLVTINPSLQQTNGF